MDVDYKVRRAHKEDSEGIAKTIAYCFEKDFSALVKDMECMARILEQGIYTDRFFVAEQAGEIIGVIACTDCTRRAIHISKADCKKQLGWLRGSIGYRVFHSELMSPLSYPPSTGNIEIVGVLQKARGKGIAKKMLGEIVAGNPQYREFVLDVTDTNVSAKKCYRDFGFVEFERIPVKYAKQKGFNSKIYMKLENGYRSE